MTKKSLTAVILSGDIEEIMGYLRGVPHLPGVLLNLAEKIYRLYKLNKLDHDLQSLRNITRQMLNEIVKIAARVEQGELRLAELEMLVARHERIVANLADRSASSNAKR